MRSTHSTPKSILYLLSLALLLITLLPLMVGCRRGSVFTSTFLDAFDTVLTVSIVSHDRSMAEHHTAVVHDMVLDIHRDLDIYHHYDGRTNLYDLNEAAGGEALPVSQAILDVLTLGKSYYERTGGRLNICLGSVLRLWHDARMSGDRIPDPEAIKSALSSANPDKLIVDPLTGTAQITDPHMSVDVGAVAKGYVMSRIQAYAEQAGLTDLLIHLGGHVLALGEHPDGHPWTVSVRDPLDPGKPAATVAATDLSVVTSGDYIRTYTVDGVSYHHIIDSETGYPANRFCAVTVLVPMSHTAEADALSTALFLLDLGSGMRLLDTIPNAVATWTFPDGTVTHSEDLTSSS